MNLLTFALVLPIALDGESVSANNSALAVVSIVSIVGGYLLLFALWHFVFSEKARDKHSKEPPPD
jgi:hypothetical protein